MEQTTIVEPSWLRYPQFTSVHINALQTSTSLTSLCISDKRQAFEHPATGLAHNMPSVAHFSSLTRLHLSLACGNPVADFQPLSQLSTLEDLALQYHGSPCCCKDVLVSCRQTLRAVILASTGLSDATYQALGQVPCLNRLVIKLWAMNTTQATGFQHLKAKHVHLEIFNFMHTSQMALLFWANRSNVIQVHELTLWCVEDARIGLLTPMPFLRSLNIVASTGFTGSTMQRHSNVTELNLINVPGINSSGLQHMLATALPHVKKVAFLAPHDPGSSVSVTQDILNAIQHGRYLSLVDLRGMTGLTSSHAEQLQSALSRQLRPEQPSLIVKMPYGQLGQHQPVIHAVPNLYLSALHLLPHHSDSLNLEMQLQERPDRPNCLEHSNVAGLDLFFWIGCVLGVCVNMLS